MERQSETKERQAVRGEMQMLSGVLRIVRSRVVEQDRVRRRATLRS